MLRIGLTGNRYSGKNRIANLFNQIKVPVFDADLFIKFLLVYNPQVLDEIKTKVGELSVKDGKLNTKFLLQNKSFDKVLEVIEPHVFSAYEKFEKKYPGSIYTIFHSSVIYEMSWDKKLSKVITVFAPKKERISRAQYESNVSVTQLHQLAHTEIDELQKNKMSDFTIHNYDSSTKPLDDVLEIDKKMVDDYFKSNKGVSIIL